MRDDVKVITPNPKTSGAARWNHLAAWGSANTFVQRLTGKHYYRPGNPRIAAGFADCFPELELFSIDDEFGGWQKVQEIHFNDGGVFDRILGEISGR